MTDIKECRVDLVNCGVTLPRCSVNIDKNSVKTSGKHNSKKSVEASQDGYSTSDRCHSANRNNSVKSSQKRKPIKEKFVVAKKYSSKVETVDIKFKLSVEDLGIVKVPKEAFYLQDEEEDVDVDDLLVFSSEIDIDESINDISEGQNEDADDLLGYSSDDTVDMEESPNNIPDPFTDINENNLRCLYPTKLVDEIVSTLCAEAKGPS